jgi:tetratricopeptide (TPR) repeat protein
MKRPNRKAESSPARAGPNASLTAHHRQVPSEASASTNPPPGKKTGAWDRAVGWFACPIVRGLFLASLVVLAYQGVWQGGYIWDDDIYLTTNPLIAAPDGLKRIWFSTDSPSQYFPLTYTSFRLEYALWGLRPEGYHWVNILLHALNGILLWRLLVRFSIPGAYLAALLFALHPIQVESVAWITERKNVLSLPFSLLAVRSWWLAVGDDPDSWKKHYAASLGFYLLALFSKTTACTLPATLVLILWFRRAPLTRTRWIQIAPFVALGFAMGLFTMWWERHHQGTGGAEFSLAPMQRLLLASRAAWFYLEKLAWPANLTFSYPRWSISARDPMAYLWPSLLALSCAGIWRLRKGLGRGPETAALFFIATLSPMLGFIMLYTFRYSFVADHYVYAAAIGPLTLLAAGIANLGKSIGRQRATLGICGGLVVGLLGLATWRQAQAYQTEERLWRDTLRKNPGCFLALDNLGRLLTARGQHEEALKCYQEALRVNPRSVDTLNRVGNSLVSLGRESEAAQSYRQALAINPRNPEAHVNLAVILATSGDAEGAMAHNRMALEANPNHLLAHLNLGVALAAKGQLGQAIDHYREALRINPNHALAHVNLALALQNSGLPVEAGEHLRRAAEIYGRSGAGLASQGRFREAEASLRQALRLEPANAEFHTALGTILVRQGKRDEAREHFQEALRLDPGSEEPKRHLRELDAKSHN